MLLLTCSNLVARPLNSDIEKINGLILQESYTEGITQIDKLFQTYLNKGDTLIAYNLLVKKLRCYNGLKNTDDFSDLALKILTDLTPDKYPDQHRDVMMLQCTFLAHSNPDLFYEELKAIIAFEKEYGTEEKYIDAVLEYSSAIMHTANQGMEMPAKYLDKVKYLNKTDYQIFDYNRQLAMVFKSVDAKRTDSIYRYALKYIDSVPLDKSKAGFYREYAHFLSNNDEYAACIQNSLKALALYEKDSERLSYPMAGLLSYLCDNFRRIGQLDVARQYMDRAIEMTEEKNLKFRNGLAKAHGDLLLAEGKIELATQEYKRSLEFFKSREADTAVETFVKYGTILLNQNDTEAAIQIENDLKSFLQDYKGSHQFYEQNFFYARIAAKKNDIKAVEQHLMNVMNSGLNIHPTYKVELYGELSKIYEARSDFKKAYAITNEYIKLNDSLNNNISLQSALALEYEYNRAQQNDAIALLDSENELKEIKLSSQKKFIIFTSCAFLAFALISFLLLNLFRKVKSQNEIINKSLSEKNILLKEIHHRVKNNLQLVSSLLTLQSRDIVDEKAIEAINEGKSRVRSMALIHQDLYSRDNLTGIGMKKYLENLSQELFSTYQLENQDIELALNIDDIYLDVDTIVPIGLIINELITNALKYAFKGRETGLLSISFTEKNNSLVLDVRDNGNGLEQDEFIKSTSFGNKLISTLTRQLDGEMKVDGENGTHVHLEFKDYKLAS